MKNKQQGFTLFEVLISMFIAGVAVLGLVMLELNILRSSQSSFNYTIATIEANTLVDKVWRNLCKISGTGNPNGVNGSIYHGVYDGWKADLLDPNINYTVFTGVTSEAPRTLVPNDSVVVTWVDKNFSDDVANNQVVLNVAYPNLSGLCK